MIELVEIVVLRLVCVVRTVPVDIAQGATTGSPHRRESVEDIGLTAAFCLPPEVLMPSCSRSNASRVEPRSLLAQRSWEVISSDPCTSVSVATWGHVELGIEEPFNTVSYSLSCGFAI